MTKNRDITVDTMRGIACILLVAVHVIGFDHNSGLRVSDNSALRWFGDSLAYVRMPLFSFLSGVVYAWRPLTESRLYRAFMSKKAKRLLVPYVVFVPLLGLAQAIVPEANSDRVIEPWDWYLFPLPPYWFLAAAFWIFAALALADSQGWLRSPRVVLPVIAAFILIDSVVPDLGKDHDFLGLRSALFLAAFFLAGVAATRFEWSRVPTRVKAATAAVFASLFLVTQLGLAGVIPETPDRHALVGTMVGLTACLTLMAAKPSSRALAWIGGYSAGIFLVHSFTVAGVRAIGTRAVGADAHWVLFALGLSCGIALAIAAVAILRRFRVGLVLLGETRPRPRAAASASVS